MPEYNNVKIKKFKEIKLKEVKVYFDTDNYNVLQITFDVNNLKKIENIVNIFPYFNGEICKSVDSIILAQEKKGIIRLKEMCSKAKNIGAMLSKIRFFES